MINRKTFFSSFFNILVEYYIKLRQFVLNFTFEQKSGAGQRPKKKGIVTMIHCRRARAHPRPMFLDRALSPSLNMKPPARRQRSGGAMALERHVCTNPNPHNPFSVYSTKITQVFRLMYFFAHLSKA